MSEVPLHKRNPVERDRASQYRGTSLIRNTPTVGPYSSPMPRDLW